MNNDLQQKIRVRAAAAEVSAALEKLRDQLSGPGSAMYAMAFALDVASTAQTLVQTSLLRVVAKEDEQKEQAP